MQIIPLLSKELEQEAGLLRKMLQLVPAEKLSYQPHEKSMTMEQLTVHLAELPGWIEMTLHTSELDFAKVPYEPTKIKTPEELITIMDAALNKSRDALNKASEDHLLPTWTLRNGEQVYSAFTKYEVIRHAIAQIIHHRAQLGVYLRLLDIPIPGSYGPSADEMNF